MSRGTRSCGAAPPRIPRASARSTPAARTAGWSPRLPATASRPASPQAPDRAAGYGQPRGDWGGSSPQAPQGPQMSAGRTTGPGQRAGTQPGSPFPPAPPPSRPGKWLPQRSGRPGRAAHPARRHPRGRPARRRFSCFARCSRGQSLDGRRGGPGPDRPERQPSGNRRGAAGPWPRRPGDHVLLAGPAPGRRPRDVRGLLAGRRGRGVHGPVRGQAGRVRPRGRPAGSGQPAGRGQTAHRPPPRWQQ